MIGQHTSSRNSSINQLGKKQLAHISLCAGTVVAGLLLDSVSPHVRTKQGSRVFVLAPRGPQGETDFHINMRELLSFALSKMHKVVAEEDTGVLSDEGSEF